MNVILAEEMGMCFGVRDALAIMDAIEEPGAVAIHGQLVHNEVVLARLSARGFQMTSENDRQRLPKTANMLISAHGISDRERVRLEKAGKNLIDTTCPLVRRVHHTAKRMEAEGNLIVVIGRPGHVEVRGIVEDLQQAHIVEKPADVRTYAAERLGIVSQTTISPRMVTAMHLAIAAANPQARIEFVDTTCQPTRNRQKAVEALLPQVQTMVVVGGRHSNNTRELVELCQLRGMRTFAVRDSHDLLPEWFDGIERVGLTAGTSTLNETIDEVHQWLKALQTESPEQRHSSRWASHFVRNRDRGLPLPWNLAITLSTKEREVLIPSLQDFQLGESSDGKNGLALAGAYAERVGDPQYAEAMRLFCAEEGRHAAILKRYLDATGAGCIQHSWTDFLFRRLRRLMGLETLITVLLTAELIGKIYYRAIRAATSCPLLRAICTQLLRDEQRHLQFHIERLHLLNRQRSKGHKLITSTVWKTLMLAAIIAVWRKHRRAIKLGGYNFRPFYRLVWTEFRIAHGKCVGV